MSKEEILIEGSSALFTPQVNLVASTVGDMRVRLRDLIITQGILDITINLSKVKMIDSTGIGLLISTFNSLSRAGGTFKVTDASKDIMDLLRTMRLDNHFEVHSV